MKLPQRKVPLDVALCRNCGAGRWKLHRTGFYPTYLAYWLRGVSRGRSRFLGALGGSFWRSLSYRGSLRELAELARMPTRVVVKLLNALAAVDVVIVRVGGRDDWKVANYWKPDEELIVRPGRVWMRLILRSLVRYVMRDVASERRA